MPSQLRINYESLPRNFSLHDVRLSVLSGRVPSWLGGGHLYRNGPGLWSTQSVFGPLQQRLHWFDGLALIQAVHFGQDGQVTYDASFVRSLMFNLTASEAQGQAQAQAQGPAAGGHTGPPARPRRKRGGVAAAAAAAAAAPGVRASPLDLRSDEVAALRLLTAGSAPAAPPRPPAAAFAEAKAARSPSFRNASSAVLPASPVLSGFPSVHVSINTLVTLQEVHGHLLSSSAVLDSNEFSGLTAADVQLPFQWEDELPLLVCPEHRRRAPDGTIVHFAYQAGNWTDWSANSYLLYVIAPPPPGPLPVGGSRVHPTRRVLSSLPTLDGVLKYQHSFCVTRHYLVMLEQPVPLPARLDWDLFRLTPGAPTVWRVVSLQSGEEVATYQSDGFFSFHQLNAFERVNATSGQLEIVVDVISFPNTDLIQALYLDNLFANYSQVMQLWAQGRPLRYTLPLPARGQAHISAALLSRARSRARPLRPRELAALPSLGLPVSLGDFAIELPSINPAMEGLPYRYAYALAMPASDLADSAIVKLDLSEADSGRVLARQWLSPGCVPGESLFVARPEWAGGSGAEDDGVLLSLVLDMGAQRTFVLLLDAASLAEVARVALPQATPMGFHGLYSTLGQDTRPRPRHSHRKAQHGGGDRDREEEGLHFRFDDDRARSRAREEGHPPSSARLAVQST